MQRIRVYEAGVGCRVASTTLFSAEQLRDGVTTEITLGATNLTSGDDYDVLIQGVDDARDYVYYTLQTVGAP